jgi:hypothetical protein
VHCDIFNGDADGIFSLHIYRLENPNSGSRLITGVKRDIRLLNGLVGEQVRSLAVFDISLDSNRTALGELLQAGCRIDYFDHHFAGEIPASPRLRARIDTSAETCTALIVNAEFGGRHPLWAICGAYGDNLHIPAESLAKAKGLSPEQTRRLQELGELFNYNGYGETVADLHFPPDRLYRGLQGLTSPFDYLEQADEPAVLRQGYREDLNRALQVPAEPVPGRSRLYLLPGEAWARRVAGVFANLKAQERPEAAHAIATENGDGSLRFSVRAPLADRRDADRLCRAYPSGGGRAAAAGINALPAEQLGGFIDHFNALYP